MIKINECYDTLNKLLDNGYFQFINNNIDLIVSAIQGSINNFGNGYFIKIITYISYCLGTYIFNRFVNYSLDDKMLYIASNMNRIDDSSLMKILLNDIVEDINIKCKTIKKEC